MRTNATYVVIGGGSQLAEVIREERKFRQDGYIILPYPNGTSDGHGMTSWLPKTFAKATSIDDWTFVQTNPNNGEGYYRKTRKGD